MLYASHYTLKHALLCACLLTLSACSGQQVVTRTEVHYRIPPAALVPECNEPAFIGSTYGDAVEQVRQEQGAFRICHIEIDKLNTWIEQHR